MTKAKLLERISVLEAAVREVSERVVNPMDWSWGQKVCPCCLDHNEGSYHAANCELKAARELLGMDIRL